MKPTVLNWLVASVMFAAFAPAVPAAGQQLFTVHQGA